MAVYHVIAQRKFSEDPGYDRVLDMFEAEASVAPIEMHDGSRVYVVDAASSRADAMWLHRALDQLGLGARWPEHIAQITAREA